MNNSPEKFALTDKRDIEKFIGIKITQLDKKRFKASQTFLTDCIISFLGSNPDKYDTKKIPRHLQLLKVYFTGILKASLGRKSGIVPL